MTGDFILKLGWSDMFGPDNCSREQDFLTLILLIILWIIPCSSY